MGSMSIYTVPPRKACIITESIMTSDPSQSRIAPPRVAVTRSISGTLVERQLCQSFALCTPTGVGNFLALLSGTNFHVLARSKRKGSNRHPSHPGSAMTPHHRVDVIIKASERLEVIRDTFVHSYLYHKHQLLQTPRLLQDKKSTTILYEYCHKYK